MLTRSKDCIEIVDTNELMFYQLDASVRETLSIPPKVLQIKSSLKKPNSKPAPFTKSCNFVEHQIMTAPHSSGVVDTLVYADQRTQAARAPHSGGGMVDTLVSLIPSFARPNFSRTPASTGSGHTTQGTKCSGLTLSSIQSIDSHHDKLGSASMSVHKMDGAMSWSQNSNSQNDLAHESSSSSSLKQGYAAQFSDYSNIDRRHASQCGHRANWKQSSGSGQLGRLRVAGPSKLRIDVDVGISTDSDTVSQDWEGMKKLGWKCVQFLTKSGGEVQVYVVPRLRQLSSQSAYLETNGYVEVGCCHCFVKYIYTQNLLIILM